MPPVMRIAAISVLLVSALFAACGGGNGTDTGQPDAADRDLGAGSDLRLEIAETVEGFTEAFANGNVGKLATYWSETCDEASVEAANSSSVLAAALLGGEYDITADGDKLVVAVIDEDHVSVPGQQPEGAISASVDGRPLPPEQFEAEEDQPLDLVREDGVWRVTNCSGFLGGGVETTQEPSELREYRLGEPVTLEAGDLAQVFGYEGLEGSITVTFERVRTASTISDDYYPCGGGVEARGVFVVIYYTITNDMTGAIQPASHVGNGLALMDSEGRSWSPTTEGCALQSNAAAEGDCEQPALELPAGFDDCTAVTFDIPTDASGLALVWSDISLSVPVPLP